MTTRSVPVKRVTVEWTQAILSLLFLLWVYFFINASEAQNSTLQASVQYMEIAPKQLETWKNTEHSRSVGNSYWNEQEWYGFTVANDDIIKKFKEIENANDTIGIDKKHVPTVFLNAAVRVYFYKWKTPEQIMQLEDKNKPVERTYAKLTSGTVVIEWNLSSDTAKMVLTTLHNR